MATVIKLSDYLKRQTSIFHAYINSSGKENSVLPFVEKFSNKDNKPYTGDDMLKYIDSYVKSKRISAPELSDYQNTKKVSNEVIFKRGRIVVETLIASKGDTKSLFKIGLDFSKKDGKLHPYDDKYLLACRDYYLKNSKNADILLAYKNVCELVSRGSYDIELPIKILEITDNQKAIDFINRINISKSSLRALVSEYETLYPANTANITRLNYLLKEAYKTTNDERQKFYDKMPNHDTIKERLIALRRLLEDYLISDFEDISELFDKYRFNSYKFEETIKDAKYARDTLLNNLLAKYEAKVISISNSYKELISRIMQAKYNGINYGYGFREFNVYDYYSLKNGIEKERLIEYANRIYEKTDAKLIIDVINQYEVQDTMSKEELENTYKCPECELILDYLEYARIPLSKKTFLAVQKRFNENDINFEVLESKKVVNM